MKMKYVLPLMALAFWSCEPDVNDTDNNNDGVQNRYTQEVFTDVVMDSVNYDVQNNLWYDIYMPADDNATDRRVVFLGHGGAFVSGSRKNELMVDFATRLAKHGYVAVSYDYRLAGGITTMLDSVASLGVVARSLADASQVITEVQTSAGGGNPYGIDPTKMAFAGNSAGAVLSLHLGSLDQNDVISNNMDTAITDAGGWGVMFDASASSNVRAVISLAGGILKTHFLNSVNSPDIIMAHGTWDPIVPYSCAHVLNNNSNAVILCGTSPISDACETMNITNSEILFPEEGHCPWNSDAATWDQVFDFIIPELDAAMN